MMKFYGFFILLIVLCPKYSTSTRSIAPTSSSSSTTAVIAIDYSCLHASSWQMNSNNNNNSNSIFGSPTEILSGALSGSTWSITFNQIPFYNHNFTKSAISALNSRPKVSTDFTSGKTTAIANQKYSFGSNIGYVGTSCNLNYWPPGPLCPAAISKTVSFKLQPAPEINPGNIQTFINRFVVVIHVLLLQWDALLLWEDLSHGL